jgi:broad specificity phosphatase PhoE
MPTSKIMVIRHAEKPNGAAGVMPDGSTSPEALTPTGWQRAGALAGLFAPSSGHFADARLATPRALYASGVAHHSNSLRPQQTIAPLTAKLALSINTNHPKGDEAALVEAATTIGGTVLIVWEHEAIPAIAALVLGGNRGIPQHWPDERFDLVWVFDRPDGQNAWSFAQVPQKLLAGDRDDLLPIG